MTVKKTQYTKQELINLAKEQKFGGGSLFHRNKHCALGWLLSLSGVHNSRMSDSGFSVFHKTGTYSIELTKCSDVLGIDEDVAVKIMNENDDYEDELERGIAVTAALGMYLPDGYVLDICDEVLRGDYKDDR